ncbi:unnamed protein product [Prunus armeniaca]
MYSHDAGEEYPDVNWDDLKFGVIPTDYMYTMKCSKAKGDDFSQGYLTPYGNIELNPSAGILNYTGASRRLCVKIIIAARLYYF